MICVFSYFLFVVYNLSCLLESAALHNDTVIPKSTRVIITGLCGRGQGKIRAQGNTMSELGCTASHLLAIRDAVDANNPR